MMRGAVNSNAALGAARCPAMCRHSGGASGRVPQRAWRARRRGPGAAAAAMRENPQNVPQVEVVSAPELTALEAVEAQLKAIQRNDDPWVNHGIHLMYEFCYDAGSMERSRFFGFSKDLYHVDHFMGAIGNFCPELINCASYAIGPEQQRPDGGAAFRVRVAAANGGAAAFDFVLQRQEWGLRKGSWQTKSLTRAEE
ncbi:MAG: hypothetical protein J3K34DRAFT_438898 [Monoraphidium minutum]|nr:MAG: hypothetical protein J3K34DRAFT_438898 [Monoraphidium minutum]